MNGFAAGAISLVAIAGIITRPLGIGEAVFAACGAVLMLAAAVAVLGLLTHL